MSIAAAIKAARLEKGLSQEQLARKVGITLRMMTRIEAGQTDPRLSVAQDLADALGVTIPSLTERVPS